MLGIDRCLYVGEAKADAAGCVITMKMVNLKEKLILCLRISSEYYHFDIYLTLC